MPYIGTAPSGAVSHAPYFGTSPDAGNYTELTDVSGSFNSSTTQFALTSSSGGLAISPGNEAGLLISINGVIQEPTTDYTVSGTNITFTTAPDSGDTFFGVSMGSGAVDVGTPSNSTVTSAKLASTFFTGSTDIGAAIADADLFMIDDGAGGTIRKTTAARIKTYVEDAAGEVPIANLDIDGATDIGAAIVDADLFIIDDGAGGTNRKTAASRLKTYIGSPALDVAFESSATDITMDSVHTFSHGLGVRPTLVEVWIKCTDGERGWATGDYLLMAGAGGVGGTIDAGLSIQADATNVEVLAGPEIRIHDQSTFNEVSIQASKWDFVVVAYGGDLG